MKILFRFPEVFDLDGTVSAAHVFAQFGAVLTLTADHMFLR